MTFPRHLLATALAACLTLVGACSGTPDPPAPLASGPATTPPAAAPELDKVLLDSGEWLLGEIVKLRRGTLVFDSDALGEVEIDWEDVVEVTTNRSMMTRIGDQQTVVGNVRIQGDRVTILRPDGQQQQLARDEIIAVVPGNDREPDFWSGRLSISGATRSGNSDQVDTSTLISLERETGATRGNFDYVTTYSETNGTPVAYNQRANANFDVFLTQRLYARPVSLEYYRDDFQGIQRRVTAAVGLGYDFFDTPDLDWSVFAGTGWQWIDYLGVEADGGNSDSEGTGIAGTRLEWAVTNDVDFDLSYQIQAGFDGGGNVNHNLRVTLSTEIWGDWDVDIGLQFDRVGDPVPLSDGTIPERDDTRVLVGFALDF